MIEKFQNCRLWNWPQWNNLSKKRQSSWAKMTHICLGANFDDFASCGRIFLHNSKPLESTLIDLVAWQLLILTYHQGLMCWTQIELLCFAYFLWHALGVFTTYFHYILPEKYARTIFVLWCRRTFKWERAPRGKRFSKKLVSSLFAINSVERVRARFTRTMNETEYRVFGARRSPKFLTNLGHVSMWLMCARFWTGGGFDSLSLFCPEMTKSAKYVCLFIWDPSKESPDPIPSIHLHNVINWSLSST